MPSDTSDIVWTGDFTQDLKDEITRSGSFLISGEGFAQSTTRRLKMKEVALYRRDKDGKPHSRVTFELVVDKGAHCPRRGNLHLLHEARPELTDPYRNA